MLCWSGVSSDSVDRRPRFVIQEHHARSHHFDLRLERDGTLWSWAVPKGMPTDPGRNRLAIRVEDHDLSHLDYEDSTPVPGVDDGTVRVRIWDRGTYRVEREAEGKLIVDLTGERVDGRFAIFRTDGSNWMVHLMADTGEP